jgi:hypothetical protein
VVDPETTARGNVTIDGTQQTTEVNLGVDSTKYDAEVNLKTTPLGDVFNAKAQVVVDPETTARGNVTIDGMQQTTEVNLGVDSTKYDAEVSLKKTSQGNIYGANGSVNLDPETTIKASVLVDEVNKTTEVAAGITHESEGLKYNGEIALNENGLSNISGGVQTNSENEQFSLSGHYKPQANEYSVEAKYQLGGITEPGQYNPQLANQQIDAETAKFKDDQSIAMLNKHDRALYDQALAGVEQLNKNGAGLPLKETAASIAAEANEKGLQKIESVYMGKPGADGKQNIFVSDGDPNQSWTKTTHLDKDVAAATPVQQSTEKLNRTADEAKTETVNPPALTEVKDTGGRTR